MRLEDILQEKWSDKYKKSINCSNPKGFSQKAHCAGKKKNESIKETLDNPYKLDNPKYSSGAEQWSVTAKSPTHTISFTADTIYAESGPGAAWEFEFGTIRGGQQNFDVTGEGDAQRVFATALAALKMFIDDVQPGIIKFTADKGEYGPSRTKLYQRMVQKYASQYGFKPFVNKDDDKDEFTLVKEDLDSMPITKKDAALSKQAKHLKMKSMFAPGPVSQTVGANDAFLNNMSQTAKDANTLSKAAGIDTNFTKNTVANALRNTSSNTRLTSKFGRNKNEATNQYVLTPHQNLPNTKSTVGGTTMVTKAFKNLQKQQANTQAAVDARQGAGQSEIGFAKKVNKSDFSKNIFPNINKKPRIVTSSMNESLDNVIKKAEIYVDMDGVLADFFGVWTKMIGVKNWKDVKDVDGALDKIRNTKDFWINLPLTPNASKLLNSIKKVKGNYNILSSPLPNDPNSEPQKREWVKKMLSGFAPKRVIITHNKSAYAKQPDGTPNILIDDYGDNISKWESAGGVGIQHSDKSIDNTVKRLEEDAFTDLGRLINRSIRPGFYKKAAEKFHEWLRDQTRPYRHSLGYYAMEWSNKYRNMDWRNLRRAYLEMFGDEALVESKEPKLVKDKKQKNLKTMNKPTKYERRKNYVQADENIKKKDTKNEN